MARLGASTESVRRFRLFGRDCLELPLGCEGQDEREVKGVREIPMKGMWSESGWLLIFAVDQVRRVGVRVISPRTVQQSLILNRWMREQDASWSLTSLVSAVLVAAASCKVSDPGTQRVEIA